MVQMFIEEYMDRPWPSDVSISNGNIQGFQLSRIERESPAWTLFLPLSRQACKISRINEKIQPSM